MLYILLVTVESCYSYSFQNDDELFRPIKKELDFQKEKKKLHVGNIYITIYFLQVEQH